MKNYRIVIQYEGTRYRGWQRQDNTEDTIQGKIESVLSKMTGEDTIEIHGAGRTDMGVHAMGQVANFRCNTDFSETEIRDYLNRYLPEDIAVTEVAIAGERFHARLNAIGKVYRYRIINSEVPHIFSRRYAYVVKEKLNLQKMRMAADILVGNYDFKAFTSLKKSKKSTVRTIESIVIEEENDEITITYKGDGFLYHMVRILTGTLIEAGLSKRDCETIKRALETGDRQDAGFLAPANGLTLVEVFYH